MSVYDTSDQKKQKRLEEIVARQRWRCYYCDSPLLRWAFTYDHKTPLVRGGSNGGSNLCACCKPCNQSKGHLTVPEFYAVLQEHKLTLPLNIPIREFHRLVRERFTWYDTI